jgi:hypothetical protein
MEALLIQTGGEKSELVRCLADKCTKSRSCQVTIVQIQCSILVKSHCDLSTLLSADSRDWNKSQRLHLQPIDYNVKTRSDFRYYRSPPDPFSSIYRIVDATSREGLGG